jgi:hypothetical protein
VIWPFYVTSKDLILDDDEKKIRLDRIILIVEDLLTANRTSTVGNETKRHSSLFEECPFCSELKVISR